MPVPTNTISNVVAPMVASLCAPEQIGHHKGVLLLRYPPAGQLMPPHARSRILPSVINALPLVDEPAPDVPARVPEVAQVRHTLADKCCSGP